MIQLDFNLARSVEFIDSHTGGEPTRVIFTNDLNLGFGSLLERVSRFREHYDDFRRTVILEPRGSDALVGALLTPPADPSCAAGIIFFNNSGYLGMCGHGAIGVAVTLAAMGRISLGSHRFETPVGVVEVELITRNQVAIQNVSSYLKATGVRIEVDGLGEVTGDIAWGGNWFFLVEHLAIPLAPSNIPQLKEAASRIRGRLRELQIGGDDGAEIDHIEIFGAPVSATAHSRNFVLCPGGAYDRSPCGTGTSAKLACLAARGHLQPGEEWVQESIIGSCFTGSYQWGSNGEIIPTIKGEAYITGQGMLYVQPDDPFAYGIS